MSCIPNWIYHLRPRRLEMVTTGPTESEMEVIERHMQYLKSLADADIVLLAGRTQNAGENTFGLVIFHAPDDAAAHQVMIDDPAVSAGLMDASLYPYRVAVGVGAG